MWMIINTTNKFNKTFKSITSHFTGASAHTHLRQESIILHNT